MLVNHVVHFVYEGSSLLFVARYAQDSVLSQVEPVKFVQHTHVKWRRDVTIFLVAVDVNVVVVTVKEQALDHVTETVPCEDNWLVSREVTVEFFVSQTFSVLVRRHQLHDFNNVDVTNLQFWEVVVQNVDSCQSFFSWFRTSRYEDNIWFCALVSRCPVNVAQTVVNDVSSFVDGEPLQTWVLGRNEDVDAFAVVEGLVGYSQQFVSVGWQVFLNQVSTFLNR